MEFPDEEKPTLVNIQSDLTDTLSLQHQKLPQEHKEVKLKIKNVMQFMAQDGIEIYNPKSTMRFYDIATDLSSALSVVDFVVQEEQVVKFLLQSGIHYNSIPEVPDLPTNSKTENSDSTLSKISGVFKPKQISRSAPYESAVDGFREKLNKVTRLKRFTEMHSHGIETFKIVSNLPYDEVFEIMEDLKAIHVTVFPYDLGISIVSIHNMYVKLELKRERDSLLKIATANQREIKRDEEQTRFMNQTPQ